MARENLLENSQQIEKSDRDLRVLFVGLNLTAREDGLFDCRARPEHLRRSFEFLVLKKLVDKLVARVKHLFIRHIGERVARQEHLRLDLDEGGRHH